MKAFRQGAARWAAAMCFLLLAGCGGGGGGGGADAPRDARNGTYAMYAADTRSYELALDFNARTYSVSGNGVSQAGSFTSEGDTFLFQPGNGTGASGSSTTRFALATDTVVGEFALPGGAVPFIAARRFVSTVAGAAGTYDFLGRSVDTAGGAPNTVIQQAEITAGGELRICEDGTISTIAACPPGSVVTGTVTVSGDVFSAAFPAGSMPFQVAQVGSDKVFLRASATTGTGRRLMIGTPAATGFADGTFVGGTTEPAWGTVTLAGASFSSTGTSPAGGTSSLTGTAAAVPGIPGMRLITTAGAGSYFAARSSEIGVLVAGRNSAFAPGFMAIGKKQ